MISSIPLECDGSGPMTDCLVENPGAIGYIDSAHGHEEELTEIAISNGDGVFLTAKDAGVEGIQAAATDLSDAPDSADGDFSSLAFYNKVSLTRISHLAKICLQIQLSTAECMITAWSDHLAHHSCIISLHP